MARREDECAERAKKAFEHHVVEERSRNGVYRSWRCHNPDEGCFWFDITTIPGSLIITGDLGDMIVSRSYDMLPWCRGLIRSIDYFAEKVSRDFPTTEFSPERLEEWLKGELNPEEGYEQPSSAHRELIERTLEDGFDDWRGEGYFREKLHELTNGSDPPNWSDYTPRFLWLREAIKWFVTHHSEPGIPDPSRRL